MNPHNIHTYIYPHSLIAEYINSKKCTSIVEASMSHSPSDSLLEDSKMEEGAVGVTLVYEDDDPDVVIPDNIARPLVVSSHLLLIVAIVAAVYHFWILFAVGIFVYVTSILHWRQPRFSTIERKLDFFAVATNIVYGSIFAMSLNGIEYKIVWFTGLFVIGIIFVTNETFFYIQVSKTVTGDYLDIDNMWKKWETRPGSPEREWVYTRTVWVHLFCVHVLATALALVIICAKVNNA